MSVQPSRVLAQGLVAGLIGYVVVVIAYAVIDLAGGQAAFSTVNRLAAVVRGGAPVDAGAIIAVNGVHLLASLLAGAGASFLINEWEAHPAAGYFIFFVLVAGLIAGSFASAIVIAEYTHTAGWATILAVDALAAGAMASYLFAAHPALRTEAARLGDA
jgi:hypothetical protein